MSPDPLEARVPEILSMVDSLGGPLPGGFLCPCVCMYNINVLMCHVLYHPFERIPCTLPLSSL